MPSKDEMAERRQSRALVTGLGPLETSVMELLWDRGEANVSWVAHHLPQRKRPAYTTIMTVMSRLVDKELLQRRLVGRAYIYRPAMTKEEYLSEASRSRVRALVRDFGDLALAHFAEEIEQVDPDRLRRLGKLLREQVDPR